MWALPLGCSPPPAGAEPSKNVWRPRAPTWALLGAQPHSPLVRPRESLLKSKRFPTGGERVVVGPQLGMAADMPFGRPGLGAPQTRLLTRHLEEVWFPGHACHALVPSLFTSLFAGKREVPHVGTSFGVLPPPRWCRTFQKRVAAPCSYLGPAGGPTALPTGSATRIIT